MHLLDVNVLIALGDSQHPHFLAATLWLKSHAASGWATCPITENGFMRILGHPSYHQGKGSLAVAAEILEGMKEVGSHRFIPDDLSLPSTLATLKGISSGQLTDVYLLALAVKHGMRFLTLDRKINLSLVPGGSAACVQLPLK
jgi:uncharacterized protein